ncbi:predicted protein [Streptomyces viridosporus ATCC 14672]|uniref:Predicted protein n=1 Tax=Streptomyces viridosporus (strain ATCC 14672 / DSM 40746 / JCM 4963 / KCTC 9882 / NRRL B-12104 / FH 1290) TaxID=566461 RepID=D6A3I1_STRV1|nr:hypothetical protein [Streptomyces viridosporus]EFE69494.1 predicted protein [Streptomyces viridosporus ATCC 14672]
MPPVPPVRAGARAGGTRHPAVDHCDGLPCRLHRLHRVTVAGDVPVGIEGKESYAIEGDAPHRTTAAA